MSGTVLKDQPPGAAAGAARAGADPRRSAERVWLGLLALATGVLYLWRLDVSGWANLYYTSAAQAGAQSWKAFFFGAFDAGSAITVDKTPLSLWVDALSVRLFGLSSWSILVPQALAGVGTVLLVYATVRRTTGSGAAGLLAGTVLATTPVAALMFRFNNPDAMLTLLLAGAAYCTLRALERPRLDGWLPLAGALVGLGFLTKMLQAALVLPALGIAYLCYASVPLLRRLGHLLVALGAALLAGGWWVAVVQLWPAADRPYIGGSAHNSVLDLALGYNGLGRLTGNEGVGGSRGLLHVWRISGGDISVGILWLLPAAVILGLGALVLRRRRDLGPPGLGRRIDGALVLWLVWLVIGLAVFSTMGGIFHAYYMVALAPAVAALVGIGWFVVWPLRSTRTGWWLLVAAFGSAVAVSLVMLLLAPTWLPWLKFVVAGAAVAALVLLRPALAQRPGAAGAAAAQGPGRPQRLGAVAALVAVLATPLAISVATAELPHVGSSPFNGPVGVLAGVNRTARVNALPPPAVIALFRADPGHYRWEAATISAPAAARYSVASRLPVMSVGGFLGSDPSPTLAQFQADVAAHRIHYYVARMSPYGPSQQIDQWVTSHFQRLPVPGAQVYDLTQPPRP